MVKNHLQEIRAFIEKTFGSEALAIFDKIVAVITSLTIYLSAFLGVNPKKMQNKIDKYRKKGKILTLVIGGKKYGSQWVITGHTKDYEKFDNQGNLLIAKSTLSLEQYAKR